MMQGFGVNTYTLMNSNGERHFVKFHMIPALGVHSLVWDEALKIAGQDPGMFFCLYYDPYFLTSSQTFTGKIWPKL